MFKTTSYLNLNYSIPFRQLGHTLFGRHNYQQLAKDGLPENEAGNNLPRRGMGATSKTPGYGHGMESVYSTGWALQEAVTEINKTQPLPSMSSSKSTCFAFG